MKDLALFFLPIYSQIDVLAVAASALQSTLDTTMPGIQRYIRRRESGFLPANRLVHNRKALVYLFYLFRILLLKDKRKLTVQQEKRM